MIWKLYILEHRRIVNFGEAQKLNPPVSLCHINQVLRLQYKEHGYLDVIHKQGVYTHTFIFHPDVDILNFPPWTFNYNIVKKSLMDAGVFQKIRCIAMDRCEFYGLLPMMKIAEGLELVILTQCGTRAHD